MNLLQKQVGAFCDKHGLKTTPEHRALDLVSEVGEVCKEVLLSTGYGKNSREGRPQLKNELGDVLFALAALANLLDVDLEAALGSALEKYRKRLDSQGL